MTQAQLHEFFLILKFYLYMYFCLHQGAYGILVPQPGMEPVPPAMGAWRLNLWTTREVPKYSVRFSDICIHNAVYTIPSPLFSSRHFITSRRHLIPIKKSLPAYYLYGVVYCRQCVQTESHSI